MTRRLVLALFALVLVAAGARLAAQNVVLVPGTITGSISLSSQVINQYTVYAAPTTGGNSSSTSGSPNATSANYSLTVNVPQSGSQTYSSYALLYTDQFRDYLQTDTSQVTVSAGTPGQLNFNITNAGYISASISVTGGLLQSAYVYASGSTSYAYTNTAPSNGLVFPVMPGSSVTVGGTAYLDGGRQVSLPTQTISVAAGQTVPVSFSVSAPPTGGSIAGRVTFGGLRSPTGLYGYVSGPVFKSFGYSPAPVDGAFLVDGLVSGSYSLTAYEYFNNGRSWLYFPNSTFSPSRTVSVGQSTVQVDVTADQAVVDSTLNLTGAPTLLPWLNSATDALYGVYPSATYAGFSYATLTPPAHTLEAVISPGNWRPYYTLVTFFRSAPYLYSYFYFYDNRPSSQLSVAAGDVQDRELDLALGELTVSLSVSGGSLMSSPSVSGSCSYRDASNNLLWSSNVYAYTTYSNVSTAQVTFAAPAGVCNLTAQAYINGSNVSIPAGTLTVVPGTSQTVDVGGPTLSITSPAPDALVGTNAVTVSGTATDDVAVAGVTVNGNSVAISSNNNPGDPDQVRFQTSVSLQRGPNTITTIASDTSTPAKTTTDTRTVYFDTAAPSLNFTPADGTATDASSIQATGTADDDAGVKTVKVNGTEVSFSSTNNITRPHEVSFTTNVALSSGLNPITVSVTDISNRTSSSTHNVTRNQQRPTSLAVSSASGTYGGTTTLSATLTANNAGVPGKTVHFVVGAQSADGVTNASGVATVSNFSIAGQTAGSHPGAIGASFAGDADYLSASASSDLTVDKAPATIALSNLHHTYDGGAKLATATTSPSGLTGVSLSYAQNDSPVGSPTNAGTYVVTASLTNANYDAPTVSDYLIIDKASVQLTWSNPADVGYGTALSATQLNAAAPVPGTFDYSPGSGTVLHAGIGQSLNVTFTPADTRNYQTASAAVMVTVLRAHLAIGADDKSKMYSAPLPALTASYSGFVNGDGPSALDVPVTLTTTATAASGVGDYPITASGAADTDYTIAFTSGTLHVTRASLTITAVDKTKIYGAADPPLEATYAGFVNGDTVASLDTPVTLTTVATAASPVGTYPIDVSGASDANYTIVFVGGALDVTPAPLAIRADDKSMLLAGQVPTLTASYSGFVNGDTPASLDVPVSLSTAADGSAVGRFAITAAGAADANYLITFAGGTLSVTFASGGACLSEAGHQVLAPIDPNGLSVFKSGRSVPVKFRVCDAQGRSIGVNPVVSGFSLVQVISGTVSQDVNTSVDATNTDTAFRWDPTAAQWIFNASTDGLAANRTYVYRIGLIDGTTIDFRYGLR